jgi:hypothetical protein
VTTTQLIYELQNRVDSLASTLNTQENIIDTLIKRINKLEDKELKAEPIYVTEGLRGDYTTSVRVNLQKAYERLQSSGVFLKAAFDHSNMFAILPFSLNPCISGRVTCRFNIIFVDDWAEGNKLTVRYATGANLGSALLEDTIGKDVIWVEEEWTIKENKDADI